MFGERRPNLPLETGVVIITHGMREFDPLEILAALERHRTGDWGIISARDHEANNAALANGARILSSYLMMDGTKFWIVTEWDRTHTTVLLPMEY